MARIPLFCWSAILGILIASTPGTALAQPLRIYAAGSLTAAFTELVAAYAAPAGEIAAPTFGPSGLLRQRIQQGEPADILASADMTQPAVLAGADAARRVVMFTRNRLCALTWDRLRITTDTLLDKLLDPSIRLATSTPGADPGGDYAWQVFGLAEKLKPGAQAVLQAKAMTLVGGPNSQPLVPGRGAVQGIFLTDKADIMLGYCSSAGPVIRELPGLMSISLPPALTVGPSYGLVVLTRHKHAESFALFVLSQQGQRILLHHGFDPIGLPEGRGP